MFCIEHQVIYIICINYFVVEGTTGPTAIANAWDTNTPLEGSGLFDGIKADNKRVETLGKGFIVITLGQSQIIKRVRVFTDEVRESELEIVKKTHIIFTCQFYLFQHIVFYLCYIFSTHTVISKMWKSE